MSRPMTTARPAARRAELVWLQAMPWERGQVVPTQIPDSWRTPDGTPFYKLNDWPRAWSSALFVIAVGVYERLVARGVTVERAARIARAAAVERARQRRRRAGLHFRRARR